METLPMLLLGAAALAAGIMNAIAGGGSFLTFPALLLTGLDARAANITSTVFLFPMQVTAGWHGRSMAGGTSTLSLRTLVLISLGGGVIGALLLLLTPPATFERMVPWLILFATLVFAYSSFIRKPQDLAGTHALGPRNAMLAQLAISVYGGYFGGGIGFLMLAALTLTGMTIRKAGATKNILAGVMNASAVAIFLLSGDVAWPQAALGATASIAGGLLGVRLLRYVNETYLRLAVTAIGVALTIAMFAYYDYKALI